MLQQFGDYIDEIQQSYELGFTPYGLHTNEVGTYVTPICVYDGRVYVLDDVAALQVTNRRIATDDKSILIYFVESGGPPGPVGSKGNVGARG